MTVDAARKARQRDATFPEGERQGREFVYDPAQLERWRRNR